MNDSDSVIQIERHSFREKVGFGLLLGLLLLLVASKSVLYDTLDPDCFWHLRVAEQLQHDGIHPIVDQLSFASVKEPWTPYSWLAELGMKFVWDAGGYRAAILVQAVSVALIFLFIALACLETTEHPRPYIGIAAAMVFAAYLALPYLSFRPVTFAFMFIAICGWILMRDRRMNEHSPAIITIPLLTALLINIHPFALFVPLWTAALFAGAFWERRHISHWCELAEHRLRVKRYAILLATTSLACLATPMLPGTIQSIFHLGARDPMVSSRVIAELQPFYSGSMWPITAIVLIVAVVAILRKRFEFRAAEWFMLTIGLIGLLRMGRLAPMFVLIAAPMFAAAMPKLHGKLLARPIVWCTLGGLIALGMFRIAGDFPLSNTPIAQWLNRHGPDTPGYPTGAAEFVATQITGSNGKIINDFSSGGYLAWKLGPKFQVLMDPRTQLYTPAFWQATCLGDERSMEDALRPIHADAAIVPLSSKLLSESLHAMNWREVYRDDRAAVLVPPDAASADTR